MLVALAVTSAVKGEEATTYAPFPAFRSQQGYIDARLGLSYTDNALLTYSHQSGDTLASAGLDIDYTRTGTKLDLDARGSLDWVDYLKHTYKATAFGTLTGSAIWGRSTDLLQWQVRDTFGQLAANPLVAATPANLENVNYLTTGPTLNFLFGPQLRLSLYGLYGVTTYQKSPFDSRTTTEGVSLEHSLSGTSSIAIDADTQQTRFKDKAVATDYDVRSVFLNFSSAIARTRLNVDAGYAQLHYANTTSSGPLLTVQLDRRISPASTVYLRYQEQYSTAAQSLRPGISAPAAIGAFVATSTPDPFKQENLGLGWNFDRGRTSVSMLAEATRQHYQENTTYDDRGTNIQAVLTRRLQPTVSASVSVHRSDQRFQNIDATIHETVLSASLGKSFRRLETSFRYDWHHRTASGNSSSFLTNFNENRIGLYFKYDVVGHPITP